MERIVNQDIQSRVLKPKKYNFEGYPEWYNQELAKNQPIDISLFDGDLESAVKFYCKEVNKLHYANIVLETQLRAAVQERLKLNSQIEDLGQVQRSSNQDKRKRIRRCANEIERRFVCQVPHCEKSYGTEGSMAQHMRIKHPDIDPNMPLVPQIVQSLKAEDRRIKKQEEEIVKNQKKKGR